MGKILVVEDSATHLLRVQHALRNGGHASIGAADGDEGDTDDGSVSVTISLGVSDCLAARPLSPDELIRQADDALYDAEKAGRNRVCSCTAKKGDA